MLSRNVAGRANVRVNQLAVFSHQATLTLTSYDQLPSFNTLGAATSPTSIKPFSSPRRSKSSQRRWTITSPRPHKPDLIKLDAEGAEEQIFQGMGKVMEQVRPMITLEVGDVVQGTTGKSRALLELFLSKGYEPWEYDPARGEVVRHTLRESYGYDNLLLTPR